MFQSVCALRLTKFVCLPLPYRHSEPVESAGPGLEGTAERPPAKKRALSDFEAEWENIPEEDDEVDEVI